MSTVLAEGGAACDSLMCWCCLEEGCTALFNPLAIALTAPHGHGTMMEEYRDYK